MLVNHITAISDNYYTTLIDAKKQSIFEFNRNKEFITAFTSCINKKLGSEETYTLNKIISKLKQVKVSLIFIHIHREQNIFLN